MEVCDKLYLYQMEEIENYIKFLKKKYNLPKKFKIILSGVGQDILKNYFDLKLIDSIYLHRLLNNKDYKQASYHAPALSIALLLLEKKQTRQAQAFPLIISYGHNHYKLQNENQSQGFNN